MGRIHVLTTEISNKIAAGEVVERPSSVIKELVENSIDAGATNIVVEIKKGGSIYMRVTDNGSGMTAEDAGVCFFRHATSKIHNDDDLNAIYTLGFRGEALSSIGAVSKTTLYTKCHGEKSGICVTCEGGEIKSADDAGVPEGTSIIVENLFFNTPARLKFMKKDATEAGYISDIMSRFILAHPEISFNLISDGKEKLFSSGDNTLKNAVYTIYGKDYAQAVLETEYEYESIKVTGVIGKGNVSRPNRNFQSFFVNKRYIKSPLIIRAVEEAYKNQIMIGKFPMAVLNIEINPELIDINVHPTKLEVKFSNDKDIYHAVYYAVKNALYALPNIPEIKRDKQENISISSLTKSPPVPDYNPRENQFLKQAKELRQRHDDAETAAAEALKQKYRDFLDTPVMRAHVADSKPLVGHDETISKPSAAVEEEVKTEISKPQVDISETDNNEDTLSAEKNIFVDEYFNVVGQIFDTYIIVEKNDEMLLIDQHAAHERLKYEELKQALAKREIYSQILLEPEIINLTGEEMGMYTENKQLVEDLGFETEVFGDNSIIVRSVPGDVGIGEVEPLLIELISQAGTSKKELITEKNQRLLYTIACKSAIKANMSMSVPEMETLVRNVFRLENINTCPHGRPIVVAMTKKEIEKEFKRIV